MIVAPGLDGFIREVFGNGLISLLFWGGLHIDLLDVLGSYVRCKKVKFTPTHEAAADIAGENFLSAATRVLSGYRHRMLVLGTYLGVLVVLCMINEPAPTKNMLPAVLLGLIPPVRLLLLDPSVLLCATSSLEPNDAHTSRLSTSAAASHLLPSLSVAQRDLAHLEEDPPARAAADRGARAASCRARRASPGQPEP